MQAAAVCLGPKPIVVEAEQPGQLLLPVNELVRSLTKCADNDGREPDMCGNFHFEKLVGDAAAYYGHLSEGKDTANLFGWPCGVRLLIALSRIILRVLGC